MNLSTAQPDEWARRILEAMADHLDEPTLAADWTSLMQHQQDGIPDDALLSAIELQLSARVEHLWGDADELEALQQQLMRPDVRRALVARLRAMSKHAQRS